jgi:hypothetical protein
MILVGTNGPIQVEQSVIGNDTISAYGVRIKFDPALHKYTVSDVRVQDGAWHTVPSVTTVLSRMVDKSKYLSPWTARLSMETFLKRVEADKAYTRKELDAIGYAIKGAHVLALEEASRVGSEVHNWIQAYLEAKAGLRKFPAPPEDEQIRACCRGARQFIKDANLKPVLIERILYHRVGVIGTCDIAGSLATIDGVLSIADWKSSNSVDGHNYEWQLACYSKMYEAMTGTRVPGRVIIRLDKKTGTAHPKVLPPEELERDWEAFVGLLKAYNRLKEMEAA